MASLRGMRTSSIVQVSLCDLIGVFDIIYILMNKGATTVVVANSCDGSWFYVAYAGFVGAWWDDVTLRPKLSGETQDNVENRVIHEMYKESVSDSPIEINSDDEVDEDK